MPKYEEMQPVLDRAALRIDLLVQFPGQDQVLEHAELLFAAGELVLQVIDHGGEARDLGGLAVGGFAATQRRRVAEIEFAIVQIGHARQALAEGIKRMTLAFIWPTRMASALTFSCSTRLVSSIWAFCLQQFGRPVAQLIDRARRAMASAQPQANGKCGTDDSEHTEHRSTDDKRMPKVKLFHPARFAAD